MTDTQTLHPILEHYLAWFKSHERLLIIVIGALLVFHFYGSVLNMYTEHDKRKVAADEIVALDAHQKSQADSQANIQLLQQLADLKLQQVTLSAQLQASMTQRAKDTSVQKKKNDDSSLSDIAGRTTSILRVDSQQITPSADGSTLTFSAEVSHVNVNALEDGKQAEADVTDLNKQLAVCTAISVKQDETITGVRTELSDEKTSHVADVKLEQANTKLEKDNAKKQFRRGLKWGAILGFIGGIVTMHYI